MICRPAGAIQHLFSGYSAAGPMDDAPTHQRVTRPAVEGPAGLWGVASLRSKACRVHRPRFVWIEDGDGRHAPATQSASWQLEDASRRARHPLDEEWHVDDAARHEPCDVDRERRLETDDPVRRVRELAFLLVVVMR